MQNLSKTKIKSLEDIYQMAEDNGIDVDDVDFIKVKSISIQHNKECHIAINTKKIPTRSEEKVILAHELGHCKTGSFYNKYSKFDLVCKHEYRANRQAVLDLVPYEELLFAIEKGCKERWELAEYFDITEEFVDEVIKHYTRMGMDFR